VWCVVWCVVCGVGVYGVWCRANSEAVSTTSSTFSILKLVLH
jgi:hypothetical protein